MKKTLVLLPLIALVFVGFFMAPVYAMDSMSHTDAVNFGQHIAMMAPEHPQMHGAMFGNMVSNMAQGNFCTH